MPPLRAPPLHTLSSPTARGARTRNADLADMSEAERENKIVAASETLEYLVHGHWEPTEGHINGRYGAWWVDIYYILKSGLPEQQLNSKLDLYEQSQPTKRAHALAEAMARLGAEREDAEGE